MKSLVNQIINRVFRQKKLRNLQEIASFWDSRYKSGGNSGAGSYGDAAISKAAFVNRIIRDFDIQTLIDFGCGDGNQLSLFDLNGIDYLGLDIAPEAIMICKNKFKDQKDTQKFDLLNGYSSSAYAGYDLALSFDVLYHLTDDKAYFEYLDALFASSRYILIYSMDFVDPHWSGHSRPRKFTDDIKMRFPNSLCLQQVASSVPEQSGMEFFFYQS